MKRFTAHMRHSYDTIMTMCKNQYDTFCFKQKILMALGGIVLTVLGMWNFSSIVGIIFAMVGCWMLASLNLPAKNRADTIKQALKGVYPHNKYEFFDKHFVLYAQNQDIVNYKQIFRLVEDDLYCYLYINQEASYMLEKSSLGEERASFMKFMEKATGLTWVRPYKLSTFNIKALMRMFKESQSAGAGKKNKKR